MKKKRWNDRVRDILFPVILPLSGMKIRYEVKVVNACELIPNKPVIYACNHSQFSDIPIATRAIGKRNYTLLGKQKLYGYYGAAEPPVRCGESHLSGLTEPPKLSCL